MIWSKLQVQNDEKENPFESERTEMLHQSVNNDARGEVSTFSFFNIIFNRLSKLSTVLDQTSQLDCICRLTYNGQ